MGGQASGPVRTRPETCPHGPATIPRNYGLSLGPGRRGAMPTYLPWLDLLRYVACVLVILSHLNPFPENNHFGHNGVALFFSISGYLIGSVLMAGRAKPDWMSRFYAHRLLRIYPALLVALAIMGAILFVLRSEEHTSELQ